MRRYPRTGPQLGLTLVMAALLAFAMPAAPVSGKWPEAGDAGGLLTDAQQPAGRDLLTEITGQISGTEEDADEDLFKVCLTGEDFSATATSSGWIPNLWLLDAHGKLVAGGPTSVALRAPADKAHYLAIVAQTSRAVDASGDEMLHPGDGPHDHWLHDGSSVVDYAITLRGVRACSGSETAPPPV